MSFSSLLGKCRTTFSCSEEALTLQTNSGANREFPKLVEEATPECYLNPLLFNGHLQTLWTSVKDDGPLIHYKRKIFSADDPRFAGHFAVDFVVEPPQIDNIAEPLLDDPHGIGHTSLPPRTSYFSQEEIKNLASNDTKPLLITLHGLSGGSFEIYLRHVLVPLVAKQSDNQKNASGLSSGPWEALVVNSRGCAGSKITTSVLYNARATWDLRQVVEWCRKTWPNRPLFGIGYSLGANILTNYLGEEGSKCPLSAAVIVSNPWNLETTSNALRSSYLGLNLYSRAMGTSMRELLEKHEDSIVENSAFNIDNFRKVKYLHELDREVQPCTWGYPTEGAYYRDASSVDSVLSIRVPTFCLHAADDPIVCNEAVPYNEIKLNPYVVMCTTSGGGHLGWFELNGGRWHVKPIANFLNSMAQDIDFSYIGPPSNEEKSPQRGHEYAFIFEPMRRKLHFARGA